MLADYHVHSEFSDDCRAPMDEQIRSGLRASLDEICFTEHVDYGIKKDWTEPDLEYVPGAELGIPSEPLAPLTNANYPLYLEKLHKMQNLFADRICIRAGLEFGVQTHTIDQFRALLSKYGKDLDFVLLSIHQVENRELWRRDFMKGRTQEEYTLRYYEELYRVISRFHGYDVLAHMDLVARYDELPPLPCRAIRPVLEETLKKVIADGKGIEFNTSWRRYGLPDTTPSVDILRLYRELGGTIITIGSDAHRPEQVGCDIAKSQQLLKELGFRYFCTFAGHEPHFHTL